MEKSIEKNSIPLMCKKRCVSICKRFVKSPHDEGSHIAELEALTGTISEMLFCLRCRKKETDKEKNDKRRFYFYKY